VHAADDSCREHLVVLMVYQWMDVPFRTKKKWLTSNTRYGAGFMKGRKSNVHASSDSEMGIFWNIKIYFLFYMPYTDRDTDWVGAIIKPWRQNSWSFRYYKGIMYTCTMGHCKIGWNCIRIINSYSPQLEEIVGKQPWNLLTEDCSVFSYHYPCH
jgi:hypothetical protein